MLPYTPSKKDNMIGWLAARSDLPHYGSLLVYKLSKDKLAYGPMQIEARIDQQTDISRELSLWGQRGSRVIRGNLLAIPVSDSFIYVEPIYLEAEQEPQQEAQPAPSTKGGQSQKQQPARPARQGITTTAALPELKRVIVALGSRVAMEEKLDQALNRVLGAQIIEKDDISSAMAESGDLPGLAGQALKYYNNAREYLRRGDWAGYGRELDKLEDLLIKISNQSPDQE
jgi:uncharacterized membrane protein (UPF0182 family)